MNSMLPFPMSSSPASPACPAHWVYPHLRREPRAQLSSRLTSPCSFSDTHPLTPVLATLTRPSILRIPQVLCLPLLRKLPGCASTIPIVEITRYALFATFLGSFSPRGKGRSFILNHLRSLLLSSGRGVGSSSPQGGDLTKFLREKRIALPPSPPTA